MLCGIKISKKQPHPFSTFVSQLPLMQSVIVTGANGNLGRAVVQTFLANGFQVTGTVSPQDAAASVLQHPSFKAVPVDLTDEQAAAAFVQSVIDSHKKIDAAVLTVGGFAMGTIAETSTADLQRQFKLNVETAYNIARPVFLQMKKQGSGRIFLIGAKPGLDMHNSNGMAAYGLSKSLLFRLAELLNDEAAGTNVFSSVVVPSTIDTPQNRMAMPDADFSKWVSPEEIAAVIHFHCTKEAAALREGVIEM
jgi:NAD(P)-dependent dehydrogenase (short-subunit alcohol dehydrogenase family)